MNLVNLDKKIELVKACLELDCLPYDDNANWVAVSEYLNWPKYGDPENCRSLWKHTRNQVQQRGSTMPEFVEWVESLDQQPETPQSNGLKGIIEDYHRQGLRIKSVWGSPDNPQVSIDTSAKPEFDEKDLEYLWTRLEKRRFTSPNLKPTSYPERILAMPNIYDEHLGKLSVSNPNEDILTLHQQVFDDMVGKAEMLGATDYLYVLGHDTTNIDNVHNQTTNGTPQVNGVTWQTEIDMFIDTKIKNIDQLLALGKRVHVVMVMGNHNKRTAYQFGKTIPYVYRDNPNITFANGHQSRKYVRWGNNGFMFIHGSDEKKKGNLPNLMSFEAPRFIHDWYKANYFEIHTGHLHKRSHLYYMLDEELGVIMRYMPALSTDDNWHVESGYVGNNRGGMLNMYDFEGGSIHEAPSIIRSPKV